MPTEVSQCKTCGVNGVRLWRQYGHFLRMHDLLCTSCSKAEQGSDAPVRPDSIGWRVPFLPDGNGDAWGYTSAPDHAIDSWYALPERQ